MSAPRLRRWLLLAAASFLCSVASGQPSARTDDEPALAAIAADVSEEETVHLLRRLSTQKQHAFRRAEVRGQEYVRLIRLGLLPLSGGFEDFVAHANRVESLRRGLARDLASVRQLEQRATAARRHLREQRQQRDRVSKQAENYQRFRDAIIAEQERESAYHRAFKAGPGSGTHSAVYSSGTDGKTVDAAESFAELRGRLPFPAKGRSEIIELDPSGSHGPAVQMLVEVGSLARSVFKGRVVLLSGGEDESRTVVIDHGGGFTTVLGNLGSVSVAVGDQVAAGAEVGQIAAGSDGRAALHFELRRDGQSLLPAEWFGL